MSHEAGNSQGRIKLLIKRMRICLGELLHKIYSVPLNPGEYPKSVSNSGLGLALVKSSQASLHGAILKISNPLTETEEWEA